MYGQPNATFDAPPSATTIKKWALVNYLRYVIEGYRKDGKRRNIHLIGESGIGKTAATLAIIKACDITGIYLPAASTDPETLGLPVIVPLPEELRVNPEVEDTVEYRLRRYLLSPGDKIIVIDEGRQGTPAMGSVWMEIKSEGTFNGIPIPGLMGVVVLDNPFGNDYGDLQTEDLAQADRIGTLVVDASMTGWEYALAQSHPTLDLTKLIDFYNRVPLSEDSRRHFPPRVLDHVITALENNLNAIYGWPIYPDRPYQLTGPTGGDNILDKVLNKIAECLGLANPPKRHSDFKRALGLAVEKGLDIMAYSAPGYGKSSLVKAFCAENKIKLACFSMPLVTGDEFSYIAPSKDGSYVTTIPRGELWSNEPLIALFDEGTRGTTAGQNAVNEIINQHTCGGEELPGYRATIICSNLPTAGSQTLDVNEVTWAFATRPDLNFILTIEDTGALEHLAEKYGNAIVPFIEWFRADLDDAMRVFVSPRCLERALEHYEGGMDIQLAMIHLEDAYAPVALTKLWARLGGHPHVSFLNLIDETDEYERRLLAVGTQNVADEFSEAETLRMEVFMALSHAELPTLEANIKVCERMIKVLSPSWRYGLLETSAEKWNFWSDALAAAFPGEFGAVL
jgi:hypothetical protein